ncbi:MAG TPA: hypothetical protein VKS22_14225 [Candidatus Binataceae bacterium]|nr:hypothetical protein [Candidatus Binataceae bacterium]
MNHVIVKRSLTMGAVAALALIIPAHRALAGGSECKDVSADQSATVTSATTTTGTITHGGILNGTTADLFTSSLTATPDPNTFSFTDTLTITSNRGGTLTDSDVTIYNLALGVFSTISPVSNGTGSLTGATGTLFISGSSTDGVNFTDKIVGQICLPERE